MSLLIYEYLNFKLFVKDFLTTKRTVKVTIVHNNNKTSLFGIINLDRQNKVLLGK